VALRRGVAAWLPPAYRPLMDSSGYRRLALGDLVSSVGDGMSVVAIAWQALLLATPRSRGIAVGAALAAYIVPGIVTGLALGRRLVRVPAKWLIVADALTRAGALGAAVVLAWSGRLELPVFIGLLAVSSLAHVWGVAGRRSWVVDLVEEKDRLAANALLLTQQHLAYLLGPAVAGVLVGLWSPAAAIAADVLTFIVLAAAVWPVPASPAPPAPRRWRGALPTLVSYRRITALLAVTSVFYFFYGPIEVALPVLVHGPLQGNAGTLGWLWTAYGIGAVIGGLGTPILHRVKLWLVVLGIVAGWGAGMVVLGAIVSLPVAAAALFVSGMIFGPYAAVCATALQREARPEHLPALSAAWASVVVAATPVGTAIGGPLVQRFGAEATAVTSGVLTVSLAAGAGVVAALARQSRNRVVSTSHLD
jgi:predicted MFS family arabinose efflux permease